MFLHWTAWSVQMVLHYHQHASPYLHVWINYCWLNFAQRVFYMFTPQIFVAMIKHILGGTNLDTSKVPQNPKDFCQVEVGFSCMDVTELPTTTSPNSSNDSNVSLTISNSSGINLGWGLEVVLWGMVRYLKTTHCHDFLKKIWGDIWRSLIAPILYIPFSFYFKYFQVYIHNL